MDSYDEKSCSALEKPYYKPIEAALRWCNLIQHESAILQKTGSELFPAVGAFPQWPCLRANTEKIYAAIQDKELVGCRDGRRVDVDDHVKKERLTVRHADLKAWMLKHYPDQKPTFLFDDVERTTHSAINADSFRALLADRDALKARLDAATEECKTLKQNLNTITGDRDSLTVMVEKAAVPGARAETTYMNIIGGFLALMLGKHTDGKKNSVYLDQAAIISALLIHLVRKPGISKSTLENKFAEANRSLDAT